MKKRTRQTMNRFRMRAIAFVVIFAMALSAAARMPMDVFAGMISPVKASVKEVYKESGARTVEQIVFDNQQLVGEVVAYKDALYYWKISSITEYGTPISNKLVCNKNGKESTVFDTSSIPDEWDYGGFYGEGKIAIANEKIFFTVSDIVGGCIYSCDLNGKNIKSLNGDEIKGLSLDGKFLIADAFVNSADPDDKYYVIINTETNKVRIVDKKALYNIWVYNGYVYYVKYNKTMDAIELHKVSPDKLENQKLCTIKASAEDEYSMPLIGQALYPVINGEEYVYFSFGDILGTGDFFSNSKIVRAKLDGSDYKVIDSSQEDETSTLFSVNKDGSVKFSDIYLRYQELQTNYYCADNKIYSIDPTNGMGNVIMTNDEYKPFTKNFPKYSNISVQSVDVFGNKAYIRVESRTEETVRDFIVNGGVLLEKDLDSGNVKLIYTYNSNNKTLESISVKTLPTKTKYYYGVDSVFDPSGLVLTATYSDGSTQDIDSGFTCSATQFSSTGKHKITVTYEGKTTSFEVNMIAVKSVEVKKKPNRVMYVKDESFDPTGMVIGAIYEDGERKDITKNYTFEPTKLDKVGGQDVKIKFGGKETKLRVAVSGSISVNYRSDGDLAKISKDNYKDISHSFHYSDRFFYYGNTSYHNDLAVLSLGMQLASWTSHDTDDNYTKVYTTDASGYCERAKNMKKFYTDLDFRNAHYYNYEKSLADDSDKVAYSFATKPVVNQTGSVDTLVAVNIRGGGYGAEWGSNFHVGRTGNHVGFQTAADKVYQSLKEYLAEIKKSSEGEIKLWITGYSRGGAVANLTTHMINKNGLVGSSNVYAYTFATPSGYRVDNSNTVSDNNIFNIVSSNDVVPKVALSLWGFSKYGQTKILPTCTPSEVSSRFYSLTGKKLKINNAYKAELALVDVIYDITFTTDTYCELYEDKICKSLADYHSENIFTETKRTACIAYGVYDAITSKKTKYVLAYALGVTAGEQLAYWITSSEKDVKCSLTAIGIAHYPEHYLAWLETGGGIAKGENQSYAELPDNFKDAIENILLVRFNMTYQLHYVSCPVDVKVYDSNNNLVVSIVNNEVEVDELPCYVEGETKCFYTYGDNFRVELTGNGTGTMDYQVQEFNSDSDMVRTVNHYDLALTKGKQYTGQIKTTILDKTNTYALTTNSNTVKPAYDSMTPVGSKHKVTIVNGVSLTESAYQNECVEIFAEDVEGKKFSHWTSDAGDGIFNDANSQATNFVMPNKDVKITAVYVDAAKTGDVNGDGKVNGKDATRLMQYLAGWDVEIDQSAADVNGDGKINGKDATRLMQYLAGWDVTLGK